MSKCFRRLWSNDSIETCLQWHMNRVAHTSARAHGSSDVTNVHTRSMLWTDGDLLTHAIYRNPPKRRNTTRRSLTECVCAYTRAVRGKFVWRAAAGKFFLLERPSAHIQRSEFSALGHFKGIRELHQTRRCCNRWSISGDRAWARARFWLFSSLELGLCGRVRYVWLPQCDLGIAKFR